MMKKLVLALLLVGGACPTFAQFPFPGYSSPPSEAQQLPLIVNRHRKALHALRDEALRQQVLDGGILSAKSHRRLQARLDRLNLLHERRLRRADPFSVDAMGRRVD